MAKSQSNQCALVPAVAYYRMSTDKQEASIPAQREAVVKYAAANGYHIVREYNDEGISGDDTAKRKSFQRMIADASDGTFKAILCWDQDRFGRFDSIEAGRWIYPLRQAGVVLATVAQGLVDWTTFAGRMIYGMQQEAKNSFLRDLSRNVMRGHIRKAKAGVWQGGPPPYGYQVENGKLVADPIHAPVVRRIFEDYGNKGISLRGLAERLNNEGIPSPGGVKWRFMGLRKLLMHDVYIGTYSYGKNPDGKYHHTSGDTIVEGPNQRKRRGYRSSDNYLTVADSHEALVSPETFAKVQRAFVERRRETVPYKSTRQPYPLAGVCHCGHCGNTLIGMVKNYRSYTNRIYVCSGYNQSGASVCSRHYVREDKMLACIVRKIEEKALAPHNLERLRSAMAKQLTAKQTKPPANDKPLRDRLAKLDRDITQGADRLLKAPDDLHDMLVERLRSWRTERDQLRQQLDAFKPQERIDSKQVASIIDAAIAKLEGLRDRLHEVDPAKFRLAIKAVVDRVELFFTQQPYGTRTKSELTKGVIYLRADHFTTLYPGGSTDGYSCSMPNRPINETG